MGACRKRASPSVSTAGCGAHGVENQTARKLRTFAAMIHRAVPALGLAVSLMGGCLDLDFKSGNAPPPQRCTDPFQYSEPTEDSLFTGPLGSGAPDRGCPAVARRDLIPGGSHASIYLHLTREPLRSVSSTHPEVASFALTADPQRLLVTSGAVGTTELIAIADDGTELPHATVQVSQCAKLELYRRGIGDTSSLMPILFAGSPYHFSVQATDERGPMQGTDGVGFTFTGDLVPLVPAPGQLLPANSVRFTGSRGMGQVLATCLDHSGSLTGQVRVVGPSDLTAVEAVTPALSFKHDKDDVAVITTKAGADFVYGVPCVWTSLPAGLTIKSLDLLLEGQAGMGYEVRGEPGLYQATCTVPSGLSATVSVTVQ